VKRRVTTIELRARLGGVAPGIKRSALKGAVDDAGLEIPPSGRKDWIHELRGPRTEEAKDAKGCKVMDEFDRHEGRSLVRADVRTA
jgi:hypothetical protein